MGAAALSRILSQLRGCTQPKPHQWQACCPVHKGGAEENQSFGVQILPDGRIRMNCFCGCDPDAVERTLAVTWADLAPDSGLAYTPDADAGPATPPAEWAARCAEWELGFTTDRRAALADALWLPPSAFDGFAGLGFRTDHREGPCWTFPERDAQGRIIGVGLRFTDHRKKAAEGGRRGLSVPLGWKERPGAFYTVEGPSDTLAMTAAGLACIGRPSNVGGVKLLAELIRAEVPADRPVVWMGENDRDPVSGDWPGRDASKKAAAKLAAELPDHKVSFALPPGEDKDVRKWLARLHMDGCTWGECGKRFVKFTKPQPIRAAKKDKRPPSTVPPPCDDSEDKRTHIHYVPGGNEAVTNDQIIKSLAEDATLFVRANQLVHVVHEDGGVSHDVKFPDAPIIAGVTLPSLRERVSRRCRFTTETRRGGIIAAVPPDWGVAAVRDRKTWPPLRRLTAIVEYPFFRPDGSLVSESGYDAVTGVFLNRIGPPPELPAVMDRDAALLAWDELKDVVCDFPFAQDHHRSAWLCALLTPPARFTFDGPAPLLLVDGNTAGAGKGLLCNLISLILTGQEFAVTTYTAEEEEMRKRMTAIATRGARMVLLDNVVGTFGGATMDAIMTATIWQDRLLGTNIEVTLPLFTTWFATGNNIQLVGDGGRRASHCRLESKEAEPERRIGFKHERLKKWVLKNRTRLMGHVLTILGAYFRAGKPAVTMLQWGSYEEWSDVVRGAAIWLGLADPAAGKQEMQAVADPVHAAMTTIVSEWRLIDPKNEGLTANQVISAVWPRGERGDIASKDLVDLAEAISSVINKLTGKQLSYRFREFREKNLGGWCLNRVGQHAGVIRWGVFPVVGGDGDNGGDGSTPAPAVFDPASKTDKDKKSPGAYVGPSQPSPPSPPDKKALENFSDDDDMWS